ncbi:Glandular kallikrein, prostatic [Smittium culicis]|uniref:Glandular kallikrein, prostatic n=1 Tax=Smittium culicis TaxID=133412 RepID=A0A1R1X0Z8_9FUNG|nr:Glandular kallikrein, prostatic [Smittium culicis]
MAIPKFLLSALLTFSLSSADTTLLATSSSASTNGTTSSPSFRIINGVQASLSQFPFAVFIYSDLGDTGSACGGTLIAPNVVITAAHCLFDEETKIPVSSISVSANSVSNIIKNSNVYSVSRSIPHPSYSASTAENDIGLLILSKNTNVPSSGFAKIYDLPITNEITAAAAGWGATSNSANATVSDTLMTVPLVISSSSNCRKYNPSYTNNNGMTICTANTNSQDTCYGDSGGPLVHTGVSPYPLLGLTSFGNAPSSAMTSEDEKLPCAAAGGYGYYTHVNYYIDWIATTASLDKSSIIYSSENSTSSSVQTSTGNSTSPSAQKATGNSLSLKLQSNIFAASAVLCAITTLLTLV